MGLLDQVIGGVVGQVLSGGRGGSAMSPIVKALLMLLLAKGASGGLGDILGGGHRSPEPEGRGRAPSPAGYDGPQGDDGDLGGFGQRPQGGSSSGGDDGGGEFSDLSGMLDGPGDGGGRSPGAGPYAHLDHEPDGGGQGGLGGGLDGLIEGFERGGLGDVIGSWIGHGQNRAIEPNRLADALGSDTVDTLSCQTGLDRTDLLSQLAQALPSVVDALTPQGRKPEQNERQGW
ncbi:YidB family protein [Methylobacterium haplocladii]|uniref:DUF937 domain-containing protein n=1 Tax=Methylobacterium haplocladii TaxID=1176176 RepID=A0A512ITR8_9HYPH|nr:YidB family protein [Methylobacterium haplocladii]GEP01091.1 hypothetical protein MHA02_34780 [Methylobacterium haplocladii]GJD85252.1 hypothetical protein HPGCJGGD_3139 [Methylobacterium haplocladii]GLS60032.1 hypothetical protein GCM10007887_27080 [Methylobacterium haplocladii]